jgi:hypothetical protein
MSQTKAQLIDGKGSVDLGALSISGSAADNSVNIDSSSRLLVGTSSGDTKLYVYDATTPQITLNNGTSSFIVGNNSGGNNHILYGTGAYPMIFYTDSTERMRLTSDGDFLLEKTAIDQTTQGFQYDSGGTGLNATVTITNTRTDGGAGPFRLNRQGSDGTLIHFLQAATEEGSISVSGTTVQLNGAHLSRWSQLLHGERETILRGTVLSNLNEMCEWGDEENEQLNRTKVSDVEGDPNVAGVFVDWDDSDDTYTADFYCAMTGDFIIRIAEGVTVQRGDLLMSAGDGTAKPQDDDIIRSKTIAKVTSTHVTCTYDDGSYCVPCVLMAC